MTRKYSNKLRNEHKRVRDLKRTLQHAQKLSKAYLASVEGKPRKERRAIARDKLLPQDRRCPKCMDVKTNSRQWVVMDGKAICKSCHMMK